MLEKMTEAEPVSAPGVETVIFIKSDLGLHARPAARLAQAAQQFEARITLEYEGATADAKSILDILSLAAGKGASLTLRCHGVDAALAAETIRNCF
ncbi:MAG: HPr family phosphocarrier protein [Desulfovibrionaceae bacterium]|nr:HPr family phosphocarrier protein [Desulfovibrionaceae bacterium]